VVTFNFPYTEQSRRIPDRAPVLEACYRAVIASVHAQLPAARRALFIGGKSMGGRIATQVAAADSALPVAGLVLLGYPLHPPGRPTDRRDKHLPAVGRPMLFVQGARDAFGTPAELAPVVEVIGPSATIHVLAGGDHSLKLARKDPAAQAAAYDEVQRTIVEWMRSMTK
jgi:predicted alpha/beta-hydrolase family hydrolase